MMRVHILVLFALGCGSSKAPHSERKIAATQSLLADQAMLRIEAGPYHEGSGVEEREQAYADFKSVRGSNSARKNKWFDVEAQPTTATLPAFKFDRAPVTQAAYAEFVQATGIAPPTISESEWKEQGFIQHYDSEVQHYNWSSNQAPAEFADHPVVLVPWEMARSYCQWRGRVVGEARRLPTASEFEKAARGPNGAAYPWGDSFDAARLNSAASGLRKTSAVGAYLGGQSARGALDVAGNVFQWTKTPWVRQPGRMTVKGSAWDDYPGLGRAAAAHGRPAQIRHVIVGFRCAADL